MSAPVPINAFRVTVETTWGPLVPQLIEATSLHDLFEKADQLPLIAWFPDEEEER